MDSSTDVPLFVLKNFGWSGIRILLIIGPLFLIFIAIKAIKNKEITFSGHKSTGKPAVIIGILLLITTIVILIASLFTVK